MHVLCDRKSGAMAADRAFCTRIRESGIKAAVKEIYLSEDAGGCSGCQCQEYIKILYVVDGELNFHRGNSTVLLKKDSGVLINCGTGEYSLEVPDGDCEFLGVIFSGSVLNFSQKFIREYVQPIAGNRELPYLYFDGRENSGVAEAVRKFQEFRDPEDPLYLMGIISSIYQLWMEVVRLYIRRPGAVLHAGASDEVLLKNMTDYIKVHYPEKVRLQDIAAAGNVCASKCCQIFREKTGRTPVDYLNGYRIKMSEEKLLGTSLSVSEIAGACGFSNSSYYTRIFTRTHGMPPTVYRERRK